jgi:hypothetical protein
MRSPARIWLLLVLLAAPLSRISGADDAAPFLLGALRRDGVVIPFAAFDGKNWSAPWPVDLDAKDSPSTLAEIPRAWWGKPGPVSELTAWSNGVGRGTLHVQSGKASLLQVIMCHKRVGLPTDYKSAEELPDAMVEPYPKDGLAISGEQRVDPIRVLTLDSPEWSAAAREITVGFDEAEERAAASFTEWKHPFSKVERRRFVPRIEAMYGAPMDEEGWTVYYIEAVRLYPPGSDDRGCGLVTSANGWMTADPKGKRSFNLRARITYCDRAGVRYMLPLGMIKSGGRNYWAYQMSGYGFESYLVVRPRPKEILTAVQFLAGSCPLRMGP